MSVWNFWDTVGPVPLMRPSYSKGSPEEAAYRASERERASRHAAICARLPYDKEATRQSIRGAMAEIAQIKCGQLRIALQRLFDRCCHDR
jgi:hypothetical protein